MVNVIFPTRIYLTHGENFLFPNSIIKLSRQVFHTSQEISKKQILQDTVVMRTLKNDGETEFARQFAMWVS